MREVESGAEPKLISAGTNRKEKKKTLCFLSLKSHTNALHSHTIHCQVNTHGHSTRLTNNKEKKKPLDVDKAH